MDFDKLSAQLAGRTISSVAAKDDGALSIHFEDGSALVVAADLGGVTASLERPPAAASGPTPTRRQREYLEFIRKYMARYGVAPAETDIQRHFMVTAPSVHTMVKTLERRGFISRSRDVTGQAAPRSIRVIWEP